MLFVVDTSVFLSDPHSLERLSDKNIVIPLVVLTELEGKRNHPELGYAARTTLRKLEEYRKQRGLSEIPTEGGGTISVEMNHIDSSVLPAAFQGNENDVRILSVAANLSKEGHEVTLLSKDLPLRLRASVVGLNAEDSFEEKAETEFGLKTIDVDLQTIDDAYSYGFAKLDETLPVNSGVILRAGQASALGRVLYDQNIQIIRDKKIFDVRGRSAEQRIALDVLSDDSIGIVSLGGAAGTGKTLLALAAGLEGTLEQGTYKKVVVFRTLYPVGGQDLGFLPGTAEEKMSPWTAAIHDALEAFCGDNVIEEVVERDLLEVMPLTHIRGRSLKDTFVIVDEAQNLDKTVLLTALTRIGENSKIVLTHDVDQRDNLRVGKYDGITSIVSKLHGHPLFAHVSLTKSERSPIAKLAADVLGDY